MRRMRGGQPLFHGLGVKAGVAHEPGDTIRTPATDETAVRLAPVAVEQTNLGQQFPIRRCPGTRWSHPPGIITRCGHGQGSTQQANGIATVVRLNDSVSHRYSFA